MCVCGGSVIISPQTLAPFDECACSRASLTCVWLCVPRQCACILLWSALLGSVKALVRDALGPHLRILRLRAHINCVFVFLCFVCACCLLWSALLGSTKTLARDSLGPHLRILRGLKMLCLCVFLWFCVRTFQCAIFFVFRNCAAQCVFNVYLQCADWWWTIKYPCAIVLCRSVTRVLLVRVQCSFTVCCFVHMRL